MGYKTQLRFMMMRYFFGTLMAVIVLGGCASNRSVVLPRSDGAYEIIATDDTEIGAYLKADQRAEKTCKKFKRQYRVHDRQTLYQGVLSPHAVKLTRSLNAGISVGARAMPSEATDEDHKVTILVTCV